MLVIIIINCSCATKIVYKNINGNKKEFQQIRLKSSPCVKEKLPWFDDIIRNKLFIAKSRCADLMNIEEHIDFRYLNDRNYKILNSKARELDKVDCFESEEKYFEVFKELNLKARRMVDDENIDFIYRMIIYNLDNLRSEELLVLDAYFHEGKLMFILHFNPIIDVN